MRRLLADLTVKIGEARHSLEQLAQVYPDSLYRMLVLSRVPVTLPQRVSLPNGRITQWPHSRGADTAREASQIPRYLLSGGTRLTHVLAEPFDERFPQVAWRRDLGAGAELDS